MLPIELLITRRRRDAILPVFAELTDDNVGLARYLIGVYSSQVGEKKGALSQTIQTLEDRGYDYRLIRGITTILDRRCRLETRTPVNPVEARRRLFQASSEKGIPTTEEERSKILSSVAMEFGVDTLALDGSIYGDLDDEMIIANFDSVAPAELLRQYNLSLTQTLLFNASEMSFTASGNWQRIFRQIKWLGLIYAIRREGANYWVRIDGPVSLFKLNKRYGTALAKILPAIIGSGSWRLGAKVISRAGDSLLNLELDSARHSVYMPLTTDEAPAFDSSVEEDFAGRFEAMRTGWTLTREPGPLPVGDRVMIPDFLFEKEPLKVYLEVVGFWTPEYLDEKMGKLAEARDVDLIVAIDRRLACRVPSRRYEHLDLVQYREKVPLKPVLTHLRARESSLIEEEVRYHRGRELNLTSPVAEAEEIAGIIGISVEAARSIMAELSSPEYRRLGDMFVKESLLESLRTALDERAGSGRLSFSEASKLIESLGGRRSSRILEALGYGILWRGISPESAEVYKKRSPRAG